MIIRAPKRAHGFTIIETLIVLATITALVASAMLLFQGRIGRARFSTELIEFESKLSSIFNEASNGLSVEESVDGCNSAGGSLDEVGTREDCIFLGKALQFGVESDGCSSGAGDEKECDFFNIYTIYGERTDGSDNITSSLSQAQPKLAANGPTLVTEKYSMGFGLYIDSVTSGGASLEGIALTQTFGQDSIGATTQTGTPGLKLSALPGSITDEANFSTEFFAGTSTSLSTWTQNPTDDIVICLGSGTSDQMAIVTVSGNRNVITTRSETVGSC